MDLSLTRITALLSRLSDPQSRFPVIHVAGTNGKGSVTAYLDALLVKHLGLRTGRFNSPHLVEPRDVCRVSGAIVDAEIWRRAGEAVLKADADQVVNSEHDQSAALQSSPFELLTAQALVAYTLLPPAQSPDVLIVEVGLGGRLDATNVFAPHQVLASVICPVDMDHQAILGDTLSAIATEKAGIVREHGLCIIADQRRPSSTVADDNIPEVDCTSIRPATNESIQLGQAGSEVLEAVRKVCQTQQARIVKSYTPWEALTGPEAPSPSSSSSSPASQLGSYIQVTQRYAPVLFTPPAKDASRTDSVTSMFPPVSSSSAPLLRAQVGDSVVPGPSLILPRTRSALTGATTALQTLFSIARDETPSALGRAGGDAYEGLRLRIAYGLREGRNVEEDIRQVVAQTLWEGRSCWMDVPLQQAEAETTASEAVVVDKATEDAMQVDDAAEATVAATGKEPSASASEHPSEPTTSEATAPVSLTPTSLTLLVDGAHNPSSALSLRAYLDGCLAKSRASQGRSPPTCTWILAVSQGKDLRSMLEALFATPASSTPSSTTESLPSLAKLSLEAAPRHRVAAVEFSTPVEGMPWVQPVPAEQLAQQCVEVLRGAGAENQAEEQVRVFQTLDQALRWASVPEIPGSGGAQNAGDAVVLCGSLYLVSDLYRYIGQAPI